MLVKTHKNEEGMTIVAICDNELIGSKLEEGNVQLDLASDFYKGEQEEPDVIADMIRNADIINMVGEKSVALGIKEEILTKEGIKTVQGIPYANVVLEE